MPNRRRGRPDHARPVAADRSVSPFPTPLALEPLSAGRPRRGRGPARRWLAAISAGAALALAIPIGLGSLPGGPLAVPQLGGVAGADGGPSLSPAVPSEPIAAPGVVSGRPLRDVRRAVDADARQHASPAGAPPVSGLTGYRWPITEGRITLPFKQIPGGEWTDGGHRLHDGVDMASFCGARIGAAHSGVVLAAGRQFDDQLGWLGDLKPYYAVLDRRHTWGTLPIVVVIDDGNGYRSVYAHFRDVEVKVGQQVRAGQLLGHEGATGHASGCHLHYGLFSPRETRRFGLRDDIRRRMHLPAWEIARIDPLRVLPRGDVALKTRQIAKAIAASKAGAQTT